MMFRNVSVQADEMKLDNRVTRLHSVSSSGATPVQSFMIYFFLVNSFRILTLGYCLDEKKLHGLLSKHTQFDG